MNLVLTLVCWLAASVALAKGGFHNASRAEEARRSGKVFSIFNLVTFQNDHCTASSDPDIRGTCLTGSECHTEGGSKDGNCAAGFGVCCVFTLTSCGGTVAKNCTYIQNEDYPNSAGTQTQCLYTFKRICPNLCQIRLDFNNFVTAQPPTAGDGVTGDCATSGDFLTVSSPTGSSPPVVCGTLTGQHMFLETGSTGNAGTAEFTFGATASIKTYKVKVTYYDCKSLSKAPTDCVQYFTGVTSTVMSYNYPNQLLDAQAYATCFRQEEGYCTIDYYQTPSTGTDTFDLYDDGAIGQDPVTQSETTDCAFTYVSIPSASMPGAAAMFCGGSLASQNDVTVSSVVTSTHTPFLFTTMSLDALGDAATDGPLLGYSIDYTQQPC